MQVQDGERQGRLLMKPGDRGSRGKAVKEKRNGGGKGEKKGMEVLKGKERKAEEKRRKGKGTGCKRRWKR